MILLFETLTLLQKILKNIFLTLLPVSGYLLTLYITSKTQYMYVIFMCVV